MKPEIPGPVYALACLLVFSGVAQLMNAECTAKYRKLYKHTMCAEDSDKLLKSSEANEQEKDEVVNLHNDFRRNVNPPATKMQQMIWDDKLAEIAQKWAKQCTDGHEQAHKRREVVEYPGVPIGQNVAWGLNPRTWTNVINAWHGEDNDFKYGVGETTIGKVIGHYTQVVFERTARIGCGSAHCSNKYYYVCNYAIAKDYEGNRRPYKSGNRAAECPNSSKDGLCDCGGKLCLNGGELNVDSCECSCKKGFTELDNCGKNRQTFYGDLVIKASGTVSFSQDLLDKSTEAFKTLAGQVKAELNAVLAGDDLFVKVVDFSQATASESKKRDASRDIKANFVIYTGGINKVVEDVNSALTSERVPSDCKTSCTLQGGSLTYTTLPTVDRVDTHEKDDDDSDDGDGIANELGVCIKNEYKPWCSLVPPALVPVYCSRDDVKKDCPLLCGMCKPVWGKDVYPVCPKNYWNSQVKWWTEKFTHEQCKAQRYGDKGSGFDDKRCEAAGAPGEGYIACSRCWCPHMTKKCPVQCGACEAPCNGKKCHPDNGRMQFDCTCLCREGFYGDLCEKEGICHGRNCSGRGKLNEGDCSCTCIHGATGDNCEVSCYRSCKNGGQLTKGCTCECPKGFKGDTCQEKVPVSDCPPVDPPFCSTQNVSASLCGHQTIKDTCPILCGVCKKKETTTGPDGCPAEDDQMCDYYDKVNCRFDSILGWCPYMCGKCKKEGLVCNGRTCSGNGKLDVENCKCACNDGFSGRNCEVATGPRTDDCPYDDSTPCGYSTPKSQCYDKFVKRQCPYMCGVCEKRVGNNCPKADNNGCGSTYPASYCQRSKSIRIMCPYMCGLCARTG